MTKTQLFVDGPEVENGIRYPYSDGKPMAETDFHVLAIRLLLDALEDFLKNRKDVYVAGNVNLFWVEGDKKRRRAPDAMVVFGVEKGARRSYRIWHEGRVAPAVCFEMASERTWKANLGAVKNDYEEAGVQEYFIFDPTREYLDAPLLGFRREAGAFQELKADENGALVSEQLKSCLVPEGRMLRIVDIQTGQRVLTREEANNEAIAEISRLRFLLESQAKSPNGHS